MSSLDHCGDDRVLWSANVPAFTFKLQASRFKALRFGAHRRLPTPKISHNHTHFDPDRLVPAFSAQAASFDTISGVSRYMISFRLLVLLCMRTPRSPKRLCMLAEGIA